MRRGDASHREEEEAVNEAASPERSRDRDARRTIPLLPEVQPVAEVNDKRIEIATKWQARALARMRKRMPGFLIHEPIPILVERLSPGRLGSYQGRSSTHPLGVIRLQEDHYGQGWPACEDTLKHELLHAHLDRLGVKESSHGPMFKKLARFFGLRSYGSYSWRWKHSCGKCGHWVKTDKKDRLSCPRGCGPLTRKDFVKLTREEARGLRQSTAQ